MYLKISLLVAFLLQVAVCTTDCYSTTNCTDAANCIDLCAGECCYNCGGRDCSGGTCISGYSCQLPNTSANGDPGYCQEDNLPCRTWTNGCYGQPTCANLCVNECCSSKGDCLGYAFMNNDCWVGEVGTGQSCESGSVCETVDGDDKDTCQLNSTSTDGNCHTLAYCQANFMNPCERLCEGEACVGGDSLNYYTGSCASGYGCTADNQTNPGIGHC